ncbi:MAG TPA: 16S rRNA (cytidine(1402)-2'-O)-methyltransferase [Candidatus Egerieenecus merdigallinarum]|nr:16S rRNA (cytidine(1402)-2'-O)-methyltransferase [Candidatus Egerieenecus merdigallinarum]
MPTLYVVGTPIGNLGDMTPRAVEVLRSVALIAAEDTRVTRKLTNHFGIDTPLTSCHQHNEADKGEALAQRMLEEGIDLALTTDAGTPCISDPGYGLVQAAVKRGIPVVAVPGCCAAVCALSISGMDTREFAFYGFLPREKKALREKLLAMAAGVPVAVVHESPFRVIELMETVVETLPGTMASVSCDLTKLHELTLRGSAAEVLAALRANPKTEKGEYCLVLDFHGVELPSAPAPAAEVSLEARLVEAMLQGNELRQAQAVLVEAGEKKNAVKAAALRLKKLLQGEERP